MSILIPKIENKIEKVLGKLNLKPEISPQKFLGIYGEKKHRFFSPCLNKNGKKVAFYARLHDNLDAREKFITEIKFLEKIKKADLKIKKIIPEILNYGIEKDFEWLEREYPTPPPLGYSRNIIFPPSKKIIDKVTEIVLQISKIPTKNFPELKKFNCKNYFAQEIYENLVKNKIISRELSEKISKKVKNSFSLLRNENRYFSHGDLNLGNILSDKKNIWIIDWELIKINNFAYDIGYLWAHLWEAKRGFRKKLINSYIKKLNSQKLLKFKELLPIVVSYLSLGGIQLKKDGKKEISKKRRKFYLKLLENCLDFNKLIEI